MIKYIIDTIRKQKIEYKVYIYYTSQGSFFEDFKDPNKSKSYLACYFPNSCLDFSLYFEFIKILVNIWNFEKISRTILILMFLSIYPVCILNIIASCFYSYSEAYSDIVLFILENCKMYVEYWVNTVKFIFVIILKCLFIIIVLFPEILFYCIFGIMMLIDIEDYENDINYLDNRYIESLYASGSDSRYLLFDLISSPLERNADNEISQSNRQVVRSSRPGNEISQPNRQVVRSSRSGNSSMQSNTGNTSGQIFSRRFNSYIGFNASSHVPRNISIPLTTSSNLVGYRLDAPNANQVLTRQGQATLNSFSSWPDKIKELVKTERVLAIRSLTAPQGLLLYQFQFTSALEISYHNNTNPDTNEVSRIISAKNRTNDRVLLEGHSIALGQDLNLFPTVVADSTIRYNNPSFNHSSDWTDLIHTSMSKFIPRIMEPIKDHEFIFSHGSLGELRRTLNSITYGDAYLYDWDTLLIDEHKPMVNRIIADLIKTTHLKGYKGESINLSKLDTQELRNVLAFPIMEEIGLLNQALAFVNKEEYNEFFDYKLFNLKRRLKLLQFFTLVNPETDNVTFPYSKFLNEYECLCRTHYARNNS